METLEYLHRLSRQVEEKAEELRTLITKLDDVPVKNGRGCIHAELLESGMETSHGYGAAWSVCNRIIEQRRELGRNLSTLTAEAEVLTSIADDLIGKTGRLI